MSDQDDAPSKKGLLLAIPAVVLFGGIKFCAKRAPKLADEALEGGSHMVDDALDGVRRSGADISEKTAERGSTLLDGLKDAGVDEAVQTGVETGVDAALGDDDQE